MTTQGYMEMKFWNHSGSEHGQEKMSADSRWALLLTPQTLLSGEGVDREQLECKTNTCWFSLCTITVLVTWDT